MDVQCDRCKTSYEFDDALISGRGTTVRCTHCGHQFRIHGPGGSAEADRWTVRHADQREQVFLSLRELQRALRTKEVDRDAWLAKGDGAFRPIASIAELAPFVDPKQPPRPVLGSDPPPLASALPPPPPPPPKPDRRSLPPMKAEEARPSRPPLPSSPPMRSRFNTLRPDEAVPPPPVPSVGPPAPGRGGTLRPRPVDPQAASSAQNWAPAEFSSPIPAPTAPVRSSWNPESSAPRSSDASSLLVPAVEGRRRVGGWIVAVILLAGVSALGFVWLRPRLAGETKPAQVETDPRIAGLVTAGEAALADGNWDVAKENFDKASLLADKDPRVLTGLARLLTTQADQAWLKMKLLPSDAVDERRVTEAQLKDTSARAKVAAERAREASSNDATAQRVMVDALRIAGDVDQARKEASKLAATAGDRDAAYVLAALDLAEGPPNDMVLERLRLASSSDAVGARARVALTYALALLGDGANARAELDKVASLPRPPAVLPALRAYVESRKAKGKPEVVLSAAKLVDSGFASSAGSGRGGDALDGRSLLAQAETAYRKGQYAKAKSLYLDALQRNPRDSEALSGLGDVSRAQRDLGGAVDAYRRALSVNPGFLPANIGQADCEWDMGDQSTASKHYREIVDRYPEGSYPARVRARAEGMSAPQPAPAPQPSTPPKPTESVPQPSEPESTP